MTSSLDRAPGITRAVAVIVGAVAGYAAARGAGRVVPDRRRDAERARLATLVESSGDAMLIVDRDGTLSALNPAAERLFGVSSAQALGAPAGALVGALGAEERETALAEVFADGGERRYEARRRRLDGRPLDLDITLSPVRAADGAVSAVSAVLRDVTEQRASRDAAARLAALVTASADAMVVTDREGRVEDCNRALGQLVGCDPETAIGRSLGDVVVPATPAGAAKQRTRLELALTGETQRYDCRALRVDGAGAVDIGVTLSPIRGPDGDVVGVSAVGRDLSAARAAERRQAHTQHRAAFAARVSAKLMETLDVPTNLAALADLVVAEALADVCAVMLTDAHGRFTDVHVAAREDIAGAAAYGQVLGLARGRLARHPMTVEVLTTGRPRLLHGLADGEHPADRVAEPRLREEALRFSPAGLLVLPLRGATGGVRGLIALVSASLAYGSEDLAFAQDLADRAGQALDNGLLHRDAVQAGLRADAAAAELREAQARFRAAFEHAPIGIALVAAARDRRRVVESNRALQAITGRDAAELESSDPCALIVPEDLDLVTERAAELLAGRAPMFTVELRIRHAAGHDVWVNLRVAEVREAATRGADGERLFICQGQDVTEAHANEQRLRRLADYDALTGLLNRRRLREELDRAVAHARRYHEPLTVLICDLDNFKYVNDTFGHAVGDQVLLRLAEALARRSRETDTVGRLGGDEFAIILPNADAEGGRRAAAGLLEEIRRTVTVHAGDGGAVAVTASIGVRQVDADTVVDAETLLMDADVAMYDAKETGRDRVSVAGQGSASPERIRARLSWSQRIRAALARPDGFSLFEQPIRGVASGDIEHTELLIRMRDEHGELIPPGRFLYIAERFGLIGEIDKWVIAQAVELQARRQAAGMAIGVHVNLSGASVGDRDVMEFISATVTNADVDASSFTFEVTETAAIIDMERARELSRQLSALGCRLALDDFGSGFGSFYYLKHLPFDTVKIDGGFVRQLPASPTDQLVVRSISEIAHGMGKQTVAEFVQDAATESILRDLGVHYAQGHHVGRAQPVELRPAFAAAP